MNGQIMDRIKGVVTLKAEVYRTIAHDPAATMEAWTVFAVATVVSGLTGFFTISGSGSTQFNLLGGIGAIIIGLIMGAIGLYVTAFVLAKVAEALGGKTNTDEMVRISGYVRIFGIVGVLNILAVIVPLLGCLTGILSLAVAVLGLFGFVIGVREAASFSTSNAIITGIVAAIVNFIIVAVIGGAITTALVVGLMAVGR
jgi:hypothetical protein